jgi:hypothetical protein
MTVYFIECMLAKQGRQMVYFQTDNPNLGKFWRILLMEDVGIFYGRLVYIFYFHLVYFEAIWYILWLFGIFFPFWYVLTRKIWQPCCKVQIEKMH